MGEAISRAACQWKCSLERPAWEPLVLENTEWSLGGVGSSNGDREYYLECVAILATSAQNQRRCCCGMAGLTVV